MLKGEAEASKTGRESTVLAYARMEMGSITMDFVVELTPSGKDTICVIIDRLTKGAHFLPTNTIDTLRKLTWLYIWEIFRFHGVPKTILLDRDSRFTSHF